MKPTLQRVYFHTGRHAAGTLCQMWVDGLGLMRTPVSNPSAFGNVRLKEGDWLIYIGEDTHDPAGKTYIRCMSRYGICWVFPNAVHVVVAYVEITYLGAARNFVELEILKIGEVIRTSSL